MPVIYAGLFILLKQLLKKHSLPIIASPALRELSFGQWEGLTFAEVDAGWPGMFDKFLQQSDKIHIPGGETFSELKNRAYTAVKELVEKHAGKSILVVAHGGTICTIISSILNMQLNDVWSIKLDNTSINIVEYFRGRPVVTLLNDTHHLRELRQEAADTTENKYFMASEVQGEKK